MTIAEMLRKIEERIERENFSGARELLPYQETKEAIDLYHLAKELKACDDTALDGAFNIVMKYAGDPIHMYYAVKTTLDYKFNPKMKKEGG